MFQYPAGYQKEKENKNEVEEEATPSKAKRKRKSQGSGMLFVYVEVGNIITVLSVFGKYKKHDIAQRDRHDIAHVFDIVFM